MSVPVKKLTKTRKRTRAAHHSLDKVKLGICGHCKSPKKPHEICPNCGYYKNRQVIKKPMVSKKQKKR
jgi:large subunit ribosomal protein L32